MSPKTSLSRSMTVVQFDNGYWYAHQLRAFARTMGLADSVGLRKDELEAAIKEFLRTGVMARRARRARRERGPTDLERGLTLDLPVVAYTSNRATKAFLLREARKRVPTLKRRPGASYRFNRWRETQLGQRVPLTYRDLVDQFMVLNQSREPFARIPHGRYINFLSDFLASERGATHEQAQKAWAELKRMTVPKDYPSWVASRPSRAKRRKG